MVLENAEWILIGYSDLIFIIFQDGRHKACNIAYLWVDAHIIKVYTHE